MPVWIGRRTSCRCACALDAAAHQSGALQHLDVLGGGGERYVEGEGQLHPTVCRDFDRLFSIARRVGSESA